MKKLKERRKKRNIYLKGLEALYEGIAQKGFEVLSLERSPFRLAQQPPANP